MLSVVCAGLLITGGWSLAQEVTDYLTGDSTGTTDTTQPGPEGTKGTIRVANANVRYGPDKDKYRIIITMQKGESVTVYEDKAGWMAIGFPSTGSAWVHGDLVELLGNEGVVTADDVVVRDDARFEGTVIGHLNKDEKVTVAGMQGKWYRLVPPASLRGYIHTDLVELQNVDERRNDAYVHGQVQNFLFETGWSKTPEGKQLEELNRQLWVYKTSIKINTSTMEELEKTRKDVEDTKVKAGEIQAASANDRVKSEADILIEKADKVVEYIDAIISFKEMYLIVERTRAENIEKLNDPSAANSPYAGYIDDVGRIIGRRSSFVLKKGGEIICHLKSREILDDQKRKVPVIDFRKYYRQEVVITAFKTVKRENPDEIPLLIVDDMEVKGAQAW
ncbi:MAG: SH3 domain-containing protein [Planctomycetota bacterium]